MARIRSIKPEFFTSTTISTLPWRTRLTFIGLWTHSDDAGRCQDDPTLIRAALYIRDDDIRDADIEADLHELEMAGLIIRYQGEFRGRERPLLQIVSWSEHQNISRPSASRIPPPITEPSCDLHEDSMGATEVSSNPSDGSSGAVEHRNRGADKDGVRSAERSDTQIAQHLTATYVERVPLSKFVAVQGIVKKALKANYPPDAIERGLNTLADEGRPVTADTLRIAIEGLPQPAKRLSQTEQNLRAAYIAAQAADAADLRPALEA